MTETWSHNLVGEIAVDGDDVHMTVVGEIDAASATPLGQRLSEIIESTTGAVVVTMSGVTFIDSTGLRILVAAHRCLSEHGRVLVLRDLSTATRRLLDLSGLRLALNTDTTT